MSDTYTPTAEDLIEAYAMSEDGLDSKRAYFARREAVQNFLTEHDRQVAERTINEFEDLCFGPWGQTREWVAKTMRERHGLPPRKQEKEAE